MVEDQDRVVLVHPAREGIVERAAHHLRRHRVGWATDQLHARRVHRGDEDRAELLGLDQRGRRVGDEVRVSQRRAGRDDLRAADDQPGVGLLLHVHVHVSDLVGGTVPIDRRLDEGVVQEEHPLLRRAIPPPRVVLIRRVEVGVGAERRQERGLVVRRAAHPAVAQARPSGDRVARRDQIVGARRRAEVPMRVAARTGIGRAGQLGMRGWIVERVIEPCQHPGRIAKGRMRRDVLDALAVDPDLAAVTEAFQELLAGQRPRDTTAHTTSSGGSYRALGGDGRLSSGHRRAHLSGH